MKNQQYISTNTPIYMVKFLNSTECFIFGSTSEILGDLIAKNGNNGIDFIKKFQPHKGTFKALSKKDVQSWFSYDTHTIEQLKKINFIK